MSNELRALAETYLALRQAMGYKPVDHPWLIRDFLQYLADQHAEMITVADALAWACLPATARPQWWAQRLGVIRGFAAHVHASDPSRAELIPPGMLPARTSRQTPYLYSPAQISALMTQARMLAPEITGLTLVTIIGLMAATGIRTGEALALDRGNLDANASTILINGKSGKQRRLPVHTTTMNALTEYLRTSRNLVDSLPSDDAIFINSKSTRAVANTVQQAFRSSATAAGLPPGPADRPPRLHDLRHSFAVNTLIDAHRIGVGVDSRVASLAAYLGHTGPANTYWYLTASPELLYLINERIENHRGGDPR